MKNAELRIIVKEEIDNAPKIIRIEQDVSTLKEDVSALKEDVSTLKEDVNILKHNVYTLNDSVSKMGILLEEVDRKMNFVLDTLQPTIEKVQSVDQIEVSLGIQKEEIGMNSHALKKHMSDDSRHN